MSETYSGRLLLARSLSARKPATVGNRNDLRKLPYTYIHLFTFRIAADLNQVSATTPLGPPSLWAAALEVAQARAEDSSDARKTPMDSPMNPMDGPTALLVVTDTGSWAGGLYFLVWPGRIWRD